MTCLLFAFAGVFPLSSRMFILSLLLLTAHIRPGLRARCTTRDSLLPEAWIISDNTLHRSSTAVKLVQAVVFNNIYPLLM